MIRVFLDSYNQTTFAHLLRSFEPLGTLIAAVGLLLAAIGFALSYEEIKANRIERQETLNEIKENSKLREKTFEEIEAGRVTREATLYGLLMERIEVAREAEDGRVKELGVRPIALDGSTEYPPHCAAHQIQVSVRSGQVRPLEALVSLGLPLYGMDAHGVSLGSTSVEECESEQRTELTNGKLANANLAKTNLRCSNLSGANLTDAVLALSCLEGAILRGAVLNRANLRYAVFENADLSEVKLSDANLAYANFTSAKGLTQTQLDSACADPPNAPVHIGDESARKLVWKPRQCPEREKP